MANGASSPAVGARGPGQAAPATPVDLRPLTTSELIDRGFSLYRAHFAGFLLLALLCQSTPLLNQILVTAFKLNLSQSELFGNPTAAFGKLSIVMGLVSHLIVFCFEVIITFYVADAYLGKTPSVSDSVRKITTRLAPSLWTCALNLLLIGLSMIFPILTISAAYLYEVCYPPVEFLSILLFAVVTFLVFVVSLAPVLIVFMRLWVTTSVVALEGLSGWKAARRSSQLVRYDPGLGVLYWGEMRLSFLLLPLFIIELLILSLTSLPIILFQVSEVLRHGSGGPMALPPDSTVIISQIMLFLAVSLIVPLYPIATTLFYYDIRIRREGFDLEFMAGKLGDAS